MIRKEPVSNIMTRQVLTLTPDNTLHDADRLFKQRKFRHIPIVSAEEGKLIGILSRTDLLRLSFADHFGEDGEALADTAVYNMLTIEQVMIGSPVVVQADQSIKEVAEILAEREFHALPVVQDTTLVGIVTTTDLIQYLLNQF